jgi:NADH dehydrogenase FAD-containing subunit
MGKSGGGFAGLTTVNEASRLLSRMAANGTAIDKRDHSRDGQAIERQAHQFG